MMDAAGALGETIVFLDHFRSLPDPRQRGKVISPLDEVLLLCLLAVLAGAESFVEIARFGTQKRALLRRFRAFADGTPSHDQLGDIFATLDAEKFQHCFVAWVASLTGAPAGVIAIDGKTVRRSYQEKGRKAAIHMVSAFAPTAGAWPSQGGGEVERDRGDPEAAGHAGDRRRHRRDGVPARARSSTKGLTMFSRSRTTKAPCARMSRCLSNSRRGFQHATISRDQTVDGDHGRIKTRTTTVIHDADWLRDRHDWPGLKSIVMVQSIREAGDKTEPETRFYITSLGMTAAQVGPVIRSHWTVESMHWVMDMVFRDDACRTEHAPANFTTIKHMAHNLIRKAPGKDSLRVRRKVAAWDDDFLASLINAC